MATFLTKNKCFYSQLFLIIILTIFAAMVLIGPIAAKHGLYNDQLWHYSTFRDNLHSLNYFGEVAWWNPRSATGFPMYYLSILGLTYSSPLFVLLGCVVWLLGQAHIKLSSYYPLWIGFYGVILPLGFNLGIWSLARQIFKYAGVVFFTIILSCFSPGVVFNISDIGFDTCVYGIVFLSAYLKFQNHPRKLTFLGFAATLILLTLSIYHIFLFWMVLFIPLFITTCLMWNADGVLATFKKMKACVPALYWLMLMGGICICLIPAMLTYIDGEDILRSRSESRIYSYWSLSAGSPLEALGMSIPGVDFVRRSDAGIWVKQQALLISNLLKALKDPQSYYMYLSYTYLGILSLPLCLFGLLFGESPWRKRLFVMVTVAFGIMVLSTYSPIFSLLLALPSPLRAVDHYSDIAFQLGMFIPLLLAAGLGLDALISLPQLRRKFVRYFVIIAWLLIAIYVGVYAIRLGIAGILLKLNGYYEQVDMQMINALIFYPNALGVLGDFFYYLTTLFNFWVMMIVLIWIVLKWLASAETAASAQAAIVMLLLLTFIDVSTIAFLHARYVFRPGASLVKEASSETIGSEGEIAYLASTYLYLQQVKRVQDSGLNAFKLPMLALTDRVSDTLQGIAADIKWNKKSKSLSMIALPEHYAALPEFHQFVKPEKTSDAFVNGTITILRQTYNSLTIKVATPVKALVFWRDAYFQPYWQAMVNNETVTIAPAFGAYKTVAVAAGESVVTFQFVHRPLFLSFLAAYGILVISLSIYGIAWYREYK